MKAIAGLAAALLLGGCTNMVLSEKPLFRAADAKGAPVFRQGVWAAPDAGCEVDLKTPLPDWPKCANGDVMGPDGPLGASGQVEVQLVAGDPVIVQFGLLAALKKALGKELAATPLGSTGVFYSALHPTATDDQGRVTAFEAWGVECGPPPAGATPAADPGAPPVQRLTDRPLPGLKVEDDHCIATRAASVRAAAAASRAWQTSVRTTRWIREGTR